MQEPQEQAGDVEEGPEEIDILVCEIDSVEMEDDEGRSEEEERVAMFKTYGFQKAKRQSYDYSLLTPLFYIPPEVLCPFIMRADIDWQGFRARVC
ncbi:MAG: hypothetical protein ACXV44_06255, partial [Halobacteriota archaeon]